MRNIDFTNYLEELPTLIENKNETVMVTSQDTCILQGENGYNAVNDVPVYKTHDFGGSIVNFKEDVCVCNYQTDLNSFGDDLMDLLVVYFKRRGLNAERDGNDILVDEDYKVASYMSEKINGCIYTAAHISVGMDLNIIERVCTKEMIKIPKGLLDYGITQQDIISLIEREVR